MKLLAVSIFGIAALVTAGCTSDATNNPQTPPPSSAPVTTVSSTPTASTSTPTAASSTAVTTPSSSSSKPSGTSPHGTRACLDEQLAVSYRILPGATSHDGIVVGFRNTSTVACDLFGYPGAAVVDDHGTQFEQAARTTSGFLGGTKRPPQHVTLRPGGRASARIEGDNGGGSECLRGVALLVTAPNTKKSTRVPFRAYSCDVQVHPTVAGTAGGTTP